MASLIAALSEASANAGYVAARPTGVVLRVERLGAVSKLYPKGWMQWAPNLRDVAADDWQAGPLEHVMKALEQAANA